MVKNCIAFISKCEGLWHYFVLCATNKTLNACVTQTSVTTVVGRLCGKVAGSGRNCMEGMMNIQYSKWSLNTLFRSLFIFLSHRFFQHQDLIAFMLSCFNLLIRMFFFQFDTSTGAGNLSFCTKPRNHIPLNNPGTRHGGICVTFKLGYLK